ncbi:MAG: hypothetical protein COB36_09720 [Alphaproteobacteria bacterium]|nr:MAG: hypothetical protein COB36_09720 [Alphaproteobacteria bacterium]
MAKDCDLQEVEPQEENLGQLFRKYKLEISSVIYNQLRSKEEADDLTQETFERYTSASKRVPIGNPRAYLYQVARNLVNDHLKRTVIKNKVVVSSDTGLEIQDPSPTIEQRLIQNSEYAQLKAAIGKLPPKCRRVFILRKLEGFSYIEISKIMDISLAAVEQHVVRGLKACRIELVKNAKKMKK